MRKKLALNLGIQTYQILTNDDEICILILSSILLAVLLTGIMFPSQILNYCCYILTEADFCT